MLVAIGFLSLFLEKKKRLNFGSEIFVIDFFKMKNGYYLSSLFFPPSSDLQSQPANYIWVIISP